MADNPQAHLFLIDYARLRRIKLWGRAHLVESDEALQYRLMQRDYRARAEQVLLLTVTAWDVNCPQHIPQRFEAADVEAALADRHRRVTALKAKLAARAPSLAAGAGAKA